MIISIRYIKGRWHWELYNIDKESAHATAKLANGIHDTWKGMISALEPNVSELEKEYESRRKY